MRMAQRQHAPARWLGLAAGIALTGCLLWGGCATGPEGDRGGSETSDDRSGTARQNAEKEPSGDRGTGPDRPLPDPSNVEVENDEQVAPESCEIGRRDWTSLDYRDAIGLHNDLKDRSERFQECLDALPSNYKFHVSFRIEDGAIVGAEPAELSQNLVRRLDDDERQNLTSCLQSRAEELDLNPSDAAKPYDITHPFCTP